MNPRLSKLAFRIRSELKEIELLTAKIEAAWNRYREMHDDCYIDSIALNLHGFYSGLERIFEKIAGNIDLNAPSGINWHQQLLHQMSREHPEIRPAVISESVHDRLNELRGFRHIVRNVYTFNFNPERIEKLVVKLPELFDQLNNELRLFADFLEKSQEPGKTDSIS